jgi:hypothetical protein
MKMIDFCNYIDCDDSYTAPPVQSTRPGHSAAAAASAGRSAVNAGCSAANAVRAAAASARWRALTTSTNEWCAPATHPHALALQAASYVHASLYLPRCVMFVSRSLARARVGVLLCVSVAVWKQSGAQRVHTY